MEMTHATITVAYLIKALQLVTCYTATRTPVNALAIDFCTSMPKNRPQKRPKQQQRVGCGKSHIGENSRGGNSNFLGLAHKVTLFTE